MRYAIFIILALPFIAAIQIESIYYDAYNEAGSEYVILKNTGMAAENVTGWKIATPSSAQDATLTGTIPAGNTFLVTDSGWDAGKDNITWPEADYEETLTLPNTAGYVQLTDSTGAIQDTVGYGQTDTYEGTPHPGVDEGYALIRTQDTGDNAADFVMQRPSFSPTPSEQQEQRTIMNISVENIPPRIDWVYVEDDLPDAGVQLLPLPGATRSIEVQAFVTDENGINDLLVTANDNTLSTNDTGMNGTFTGTIPLSTNTTQIIITASDGAYDDEKQVTIELLAVAAIAIPEQLSMTITPGDSEDATLLVENVGTTPVSLHIKGTRPSLAERILGDITYTVLQETFPLGQEARAHNIALAPGQETAIDVHVTAGFVPAGNYVGQILIAGVPS